MLLMIIINTSTFMSSSSTSTLTAPGGAMSTWTRISVAAREAGQPSHQHGDLLPGFRFFVFFLIGFLFRVEGLGVSSSGLGLLGLMGSCRGLGCEAFKPQFPPTVCQCVQKTDCFLHGTPRKEVLHVLLFTVDAAKRVPAFYYFFTQDARRARLRLWYGAREA